jgi:hypothetical protein
MVHIGHALLHALKIGIRHILGNSLGVDFGLRTFRRCPGTDFEERDEPPVAGRLSQDHNPRYFEWL